MIDTAFLPDVQDFFKSEDLSDISLILEEEQSVTSSKIGDKRKEPEPNEDAEDRERCILPAHSMVLVAFSTYCRTKLKSWTQGAFHRPEISLPVPRGQLPVGELLVQCMYAAQPDLSATSQCQLLQLLVLSDRYGVRKALVAAVAALKSIPVSELQWDTAMGVFGLPPGCAEADACTGLYSAAGQKLQQELGDLELVWADQQGQKQQQLRGLPHAALKQLLSDEATRVASENTVFYTIEQWYNHQTEQQRQRRQRRRRLRQQRLQQPQQQPEQQPQQQQQLEQQPQQPEQQPQQQRRQRQRQRSDEELQELVGLIRMQHCTQPFVGTIMSQSPVAAKCFTPLELHLASMCSSTGGPAAQHMLDAVKDTPTATKYPAWCVGKRPASAMDKLTVQWRPKLADVQHLVEQYLKGPKGSDGMYSEESSGGCWQGQHFHFGMEAAESSSEGDSSAANPFQLGLFVEASDRPVGSLCIASFSVTGTAAAPSGSQLTAQQSSEAARDVCLRQEKLGLGDFSYGWPNFFGFTAISSWAAAEARLREQQLVHPDGCLHLMCEVTEVL